MPLNIPSGSDCFVDSNILVYHFVEIGGSSAACRAFLGRVLRSEVVAFSTAACLADAVHRVMATEAQERFKLKSKVVAWLQQHQSRIQELSAFLSAAKQLERLPLPLITVDQVVIHEAAEISRQHGLLTNDAVIVAAMRQQGLTHLATNDNDFDGIPGLSVWKPR